MSNLRRGEEHCRGVRAGSHAGATTDASSGFERAVRILLGNGSAVSIRSCTGVHRDVSTGLDDTVQGASVNNQVLNDRECFCTPGFDGDDITIIEGAHVQLAGRGDLRAVGNAVDDNATLTTDALTAVRVKCDRFFAASKELFVQHVEHFQERGFLRDAADLVFVHGTRILGSVLAPNLQCQVHL